jgi:hypothetical protein
MIYLTLGEGIRKGVTLYSGLHDNKPPLLYITAAIAGNLFWFKAILAAWHAITVYLFWKLADHLFPSGKKVPAKQRSNNKLLIIASTVLFALFTTLPTLEGNIANAELFMIGPIIAAFYILLSKRKSPKNLVISGVLFSIATLFKVPAAFDLAAIVFIWLVTNKLTRKSLKEIAINTGYLVAGFLLPIFISLIWYFLKGAFSEYFIAAFLQNVGYLSSWRPEDTREPFIVKNGPLLIRALVVTVGFILLFIKRKKLSKNFIFLTAWLLLTLFAVSLSERPYPHYMVQSIAPMSLLAGMIIAKKNMEQVLAIIPLSLAFLVPVYFNFWNYPTLPYYAKFIKFASGQISRQEYLRTFGNHIPRNYDISRYIRESTNSNANIYVWGDTSMIYALSRRLPPIKYVADYHIRDFSSQKLVADQIKENMPEIIVIMPDSPAFPELNLIIYNNYGLVEEFDGAKVFKLLDSDLRRLIAP